MDSDILISLLGEIGIAGIFAYALIHLWKYITKLQQQQQEYDRLLLAEEKRERQREISNLRERYTEIITSKESEIHALREQLDHLFKAVTKRANGDSGH
jgi:SMC interacting uncharacterized protein involved in chromosome segregation